MSSFRVEDLTVLDKELLLEFAEEAMDIFQWHTFDEDTDQCEWCLWEPSWVPEEHHCLLMEVAWIVERIKDES